MCLKGTLFTPLSEHNTSTQSLNVQLRKTLDLHVNLVHGWTMPGVPTRFSDVDIVVIRCCCCCSWRRPPALSTWHEDRAHPTVYCTFVSASGACLGTK